MPKVSLTVDNKQQQSTDFPRLKLEHGERALILCVEPEPTMEYRHVLQAPEIGPDGKVIKEVKKNSKQEEYETSKLEFMGQHLCFGDFNTLQANGVDPENCPTCQAAKDEEGILPPKPHYAMHVIKYAVQPGGWNPRDPFAVSLEAWVFSPTRLNTIIDLAAEWGDLRRHDLKLGPCENKGYQKYDINVSANAQWLSGKSDEEIAARKRVVEETYNNNQAPDLSTLIARRISKGDALSDIQKVVERYGQINKRATSVPDFVQPTKPATQQSSGLDVFKSTTDDAGNTVDTTTGEVSEPKSMKAMDFSDIMADL